ncbi:hypothetical protein K491DRAFT_125225 [Lophiostoma macrostomum CBS 122681]|uniref:Uncharacterized protein n=1 Tax=Lophiostoma macrostomum CBS 122681 TaxID=1314788 RepID=A0A6A6ST22_9PLEO|nr:hypothetical protein K491DRAFT_125225 [Lophiostoma macrostomum CBS 122681]
MPLLRTTTEQLHKPQTEDYFVISSNSSHQLRYVVSIHCSNTRNPRRTLYVPKRDDVSPRMMEENIVCQLLVLD